MRLSFSILMILALTSLVFCSRNYELSPDAVFSPEKTKYIDFYGERPDNIQLIVGFEKTLTHTAAGVFSIKTDKEDLKIEWIDEKNLLIEYPSYKEVYQRIDSVKSFNEQLKIHYQSYMACEIIENKTTGFMDTITAFATVQFTDNVQNRTVALIGEDKKTIHLPMKKAGKYGNIHIPSGNYKIYVERNEEKCYSAAIPLKSGEIKLITLDF